MNVHFGGASSKPVGKKQKKTTAKSRERVISETGIEKDVLKGRGAVCKSQKDNVRGVTLSKLPVHKL